MESIKQAFDQRLTRERPDNFKLNRKMDKRIDFTVGVIMAFLLPVLMWLLLWYGAFSYGYVACQFHDWFVAPILPQVPKFSIYEYAGLSLFISIFTSRASAKAKPIKKEYLDEGWWAKWEAIVTSVVKPWGLLLAGYVLQYWIK